MKTMYISIENGIFKDLTNLKEREIHTGVKYILGSDYIIFTMEDSIPVVSRFLCTGTLLYRYEFKKDGNYMITPLFVDEYTKVPHQIRELYHTLKKNFSNFYLEESLELDKPFQIVYVSWVDIKLEFKFTISVNPDLLDKNHSKEIVSTIHQMKAVDLLKLHKILAGRSIFIDKEALDQMTDLGMLFSS